MADWEVREPDPKTQQPVEVWWGRKRMSAHDTVAAAKRKAERLMATYDPEGSLFHIEPDGYKVRLRGQRKGWRAS